MLVRNDERVLRLQQGREVDRYCRTSPCRTVGRETLAGLLGAVGRVTQAIPVAVDVGALHPLQPALRGAVGQAVALILGTVGRIGETTLLAHVVHARNILECRCGQAHPRGYHQRLQRPGLILSVNSSEGITANGAEGEGWEGSDYRVDLYICTVPEHLLGTTAHSLGTVGTDPPGVTGVVRPLHDTLRTREPKGKIHFVVKLGNLGRVERHIELMGSRVICQHQGVQVKTFLRGFVETAVGRADLQLKMAPMVCTDINLDIDGLAHGVPPTDDPVAVPTASLVVTWFRRVVPVTAYAAFPLIVLPLNREAAAVELIVVVVHRVVEPEPPHCVSSWRVSQHPVAGQSVDLYEEKEQSGAETS